MVTYTLSTLFVKIEKFKSLNKEKVSLKCWNIKKGSIYKSTSSKPMIICSKKETFFISDLQISLIEQSIFGWFSFTLHWVSTGNRKSSFNLQKALRWNEKKSFWTYKRSKSLSKSLSWGCLLCLLFRKSVDVPWRLHIGVFWQNLVQK